jgi:hypothetical protein
MKTLTVILWMATIAAAQEPSLQRVVDESARLRQMPAPHEESFWDNLKIYRERSAALRTALRDWVDALLPKSRSTLQSELPLVQARINAELWRSGLLVTDSVVDDDHFQPGRISGLSVSQAPEDPDKVLVAASLNMPCGAEDSAYIYDYSQGSPRRVLEVNPSRDDDETLSGVHFSPRSQTGGQSILVLRFPIQCASTWSTLSYDLFRQSAAGVPAVLSLSGDREIKDWDYEVRLTPDELLIELQGRSIDAGILIRTHELRYDSKSRRIDPVALLPQDFVDEWLTRPWAEMESRSVGSSREKLKQWHEFLGDGAGEFSLVQACTERRSQWQIGVELYWVHDKELPEPLRVYFLVQQADPYRFEMSGISFERQDGCPGEGQASSDRPSLFPRKAQ